MNIVSSTSLFLTPAHHFHTRVFDPSSSTHGITAAEQKPAIDAHADVESARTALTIYRSTTVHAPTASYRKEERERRVDEYASRVKAQISHIESGNEGIRNVNFQHTRQFMEPSGYFSAGLLAAGYDPHEKITVTFTSYVGKGKPETQTSQDARTYFAWEIAAGALAHDKVQRGGPINFQFMEIEQPDRSKVADLESLGTTLQNHWESDIATPMRSDSGVLAKRSGRADAYVLRGTLQNLSNAKGSFDTLSPEAKHAVDRTLKNDGQVIIPNIYGYPLSGYAFIPYMPYDGNYEHRPNQGVMVDFRNGVVHEITGDRAFAAWAKNNRDTVLSRFNAGDRQAHMDAHWPKAGDVLQNLIAINHASYPGYQNLVKDHAIPVLETFNYTRARGDNYQLKIGSLNNNIAAQYQAVNTRNAIWSDQTEVFGSSQQSWKAAKEFWGNTFGYIPLVANTGNIVFGVHDGMYGKTADDRVGGNAAAVISGLQLAHDMTPIGVEAGLGEPPLAFTLAKQYNWRANPQTRDVELVRAPRMSTESHMAAPAPTPEVNPLRPSQAGHISRHAVPNAEQLLEHTPHNAKGIYQIKDPASGADHWFIRYTDATGVPLVYEIKGDFKLSNGYVQIIDPEKRTPILTVHSEGQGEWRHVAADGGIKWPWRRPPSPTMSDKLPPRFADLFADIDGHALKQAETFDEFLNVDETKPYSVSTRGYEENGVLKRKLNIEWKAAENTIEIYPSEKAGATEQGSSAYSPAFIRDLNRSDYTVIKACENGDISFPLNAGGRSTEIIQHNRLLQFERAIPNEDLRASISEVAHQGSLFPAHAELQSILKEGYGGKASHIAYLIDYDPLRNETQVSVTAKWYLNDLTGDNPRSIPDLEATTTRTFTIRESNAVSGNAYNVDTFAPTQMEISLPAQLPQ